MKGRNISIHDFTGGNIRPRSRLNGRTFNTRPVVRAAVDGYYLPGAVRPVPDFTCATTELDGLIARCFMHVPEANNVIRNCQRIFTKHWFTVNQIKTFRFPEEMLLSEAEGIESRDVPEWRKEQLREQSEEYYGTLLTRLNLQDSPERRKFLLKWKLDTIAIFTKDENYPKYKSSRNIAPYHDVLKNLNRPFVVMFERVIEGKDFEIAGIGDHKTPDEKVDWMMDNLTEEGMIQIANDFTAMERHHNREAINRFADILTNAFGSYKAWPEWSRTFVQMHTRRKFQTRHYRGTLNDVLGSGSDWTKDINTFLNKWYMEFMSCVLNYIEGHSNWQRTIVQDMMKDDFKWQGRRGIWSAFKSVVPPKWLNEHVGTIMDESTVIYCGDDSAGQWRGRVPTNQELSLIGGVMKFECDVYQPQSFCQLVVDPDARQLIVDPAKIVVTFGWINHKYARSRKSKKMTLLRSKALSYAYQYPACPIVSALAKAVMKDTAGYDVRHINEYRRDIDNYKRKLYIEASKIDHTNVFKEIKWQTRLLFEEQFGITVKQQNDIEKQLDSGVSITDIDWSALIIDESNYHCWDQYVVEAGEEEYNGITLEPRDVPSAHKFVNRQGQQVATPILNVANPGRA